MVFRRGKQREEPVRPRHDRRAVDRHPLGWESRFAVHDASRIRYLTDDDRAPCVVSNVSVAGAGLVLSGSSVEVGDRVVLDLPLTPRRGAKITLDGVVRHAQAVDDDQVAAGVEFVEPGALERALILQLVEEQSRSGRRSA